MVLDRVPCPSRVRAIEQVLSMIMSSQNHAISGDEWCTYRHETSTAESVRICCLL